MLSIVMDVHRNISAAQCFVKFCGNDTSVNCMEIIGTKTDLTISLFGKNDFLRKTKISTPENFFIPTSLSSDVNITSCINDMPETHDISQKLQELKTLSEHQINCKSKYLPSCTAPVLDESKVSESTKNSHPILEIKEGYFKIFVKIHCLNNHLLGSKHILKTNFRLQFTNSEEIPCSNNFTMTLITPQKFLKSHIQSNNLYNVLCTNCTSIISGKPILLTDVKEYNASFSDLSENWFCHKHDSTCPLMTKETLYVDDLCILLDSSCVENSSLEKQGSEYKCKACNIVLTSGIITYNSQNFRRFFVDAVKLSLPCSILSDYKKYKQDIVMLCLLNIIRNNMSDMSACKLYFQSNVQGNENCLLLRILPSQGTQFTLQMAIENIPAEVNLITNKVYKVQYHVSSKCSTIVNLWRREFDVEFFKVSNFFLEVVIQYLKSSSDCIPSGQTEVKDFFNACLPSTYESYLNCCT